MDTEKSTRQKRKPDFQEQLVKGEYVDANCYLSKQWRLALITDVLNGEVEAAFEGTWKNSKEMFKFNSSRITFARKLSIGSNVSEDTANARLCHDYIPYSNERCQQVQLIKQKQQTDELSKLIETQFEGVTAIQITQIVRCKQFMFLDQVLSLDENRSAVPYILKYLNMFLQFIKFYLDLLPDYQADLSRHHANPDLYLIDERVAIAACFPEVLEELGMISGCMWRLLSTQNCVFWNNYEHFQMIPMPISEIFTQIVDIQDYYICPRIDTEKCIKKTYQFFWGIMTYFESIGGFEQFFALPRFLNLKSLGSYLFHFQCLLKFWPKPDQRLKVKQLIQIISDRVEKLSIAELKEIELDSLKDALQTNKALEYYFSAGPLKLNGFIESLTMTVTLRFLASPFLEKKVKALIEIKELVERFEGFYTHRPRPSISKQALIQWITNNEVLERVLIGDNLHSELIKRATELAAFLSKNDEFPIDMIDRIWESAQNKHESIKQSIYEFLEGLTRYLTLDGLDRVQSLISRIKDYNEMSLNLIYKFTEQALSRSHTMETYQGIETNKFYGMDQLWMLMQDYENVPPSISELAFQQIRQLVQMLPHTRLFNETHFGKCMELIRDHKAIYQAISISSAIIDKQYLNDHLGRRKLIMSQDKRFNIVELFVSDIEVYLAHARQYFKDQPTQNVPLPGCTQLFQNNIHFRIQMLSFLVQYSDLKITYEQLLRLWDSCCRKTKGSIQKSELIKAFQIEGQLISQHYFPDRGTQTRFFNEVLCNPNACDYENFTMDEISLWYFLSHTITNHQQNTQGHIQKQHGLELPLCGIDSLWQILEVVKEQRIQERIMSLLMHAYSEQLPNTIQLAYQELIARSLRLNQHRRCITFLKYMLQYYETGLVQITYDPNKLEVPYEFVIQGRLRQIMAPTYMQASHLKKRLSEILVQPYKAIHFYLQGQSVLEDQYIPQELSPIDVLIDHYHPKHYLAQNAQFETLFARLESDPEDAHLTWDLISQLPINKHIEERLLRFEVDWTEIFNQGFYRVMYYLKPIFNYSHNHQPWKEGFKETGGLQALVDHLLARQFDFAAREQELHAAFIMIEVMHHYDAKRVLNIDTKNLEQQCYRILRQLMITSQGHETEGHLIGYIFRLLDNRSQFILSNGPEEMIKSLLIQSPSVHIKQNFKQVILALEQRQYWEMTLEQQQSSIAHDSDPIYLILIQKILPWVFDNNLQNSEFFFDTIVTHLRQFRELPNDLVQHMINMLDQVDGVVRSGTYEVLNLVPLSEEQAITVINTVFRQSLKDQVSSSGFKCVQTLIETGKGTSTFIEMFTNLLMCKVWRTRQHANWSLRNNMNEKSVTGYAGLQNLACICYMNSLLQQLYMIPGFREPLLHAEDRSDIPREENLLYQTQCLMAALKYTEKQYYNPRRFCQAFKDLEGHPVNVFEQMDVDEFFNLLMDRLDNQLKEGRDANLISHNFRGTMVNEVIGKECSHVSEQEEAFIAISLTVKSKKTIQQSLQSVIKGDTLEGDNAYHCEKCDKKVNAVKRMCIKRLPPQLILVLKRFEFDFDVMVKVKVNDRCEFPFELDMAPYTHHGLQQSNPQQDVYDLKGVVVHQGSADSGHYYSFVKENGTARWIQFNDTQVTLSSQEEVIAEGYGGTFMDRRQRYVERSKNAYLLFYERRNPEQLQIESVKPNLPHFLRELHEENEKFAIQRVVFHQDFFQFTTNLLNREKVEPRIFLFTLQHMFTCAVRELSRGWINVNYQRCIHHLKAHPNVAHIVSLTLTQQHYLKEYLQDCPYAHTRRYVVGIIATAAITAQHIDLDSCLMFLNDAKHKNYCDFLDLIRRLANHWPREFIQKGGVARLIDFFVSTTFKPKKLKLVIEDLPVAPLTSTLFGSPEVSGTELSYYEEALERRFEKTSTRSSSRQYLWMTLASSLRYSIENNIILSDQELKALVHDPNFHHWMIEDTDCKQALLAVSNILCDWFKNQSATRIEGIVLLLRDQINNKDFKFYYKYLTILKHLMLIEDQYQDIRIDFIMTHFLDISRTQLNFIMETDICQQYLLRVLIGIKQQFCAASPKIQAWMMQNTGEWRAIYDELATQIPPTESVLDKNKQTNYTKHRLYGIYQPISQINFKRLILWKRAQFTRLLNGEGVQIDNQNFEIQLTKVQRGEAVDYYSAQTNKWHKATVISLNDEFVTVQIDPTQDPIMVDRDSEHLAPFGTLSVVNQPPGVEVPEPDNVRLVQPLQSSEAEESNGAVQSQRSDTQDGNAGSQTYDSDQQ